MNDIVEIIETLLLTPPAATEAEVKDLLADVAGRGPGQYGARLKDWLESDLSIYPEPITVELTDNPDDHGIDLLVTGRQTKLRVGFQIKSDNDLKAEQEKFVREAKAQYAEAMVWGLSLYVFVMACRRTPGNIRKYTYLQNYFARMPNRNVLWLDPSRAAGLLRAFDSRVPTLAHRPKGWVEFFLSARQRNLADVYLNEHGLEPQERFQPPSQWDELVTATDSRPLTVLTGPPAVGKTFTALQLLWRAFQQGRKIVWIAPPRPTQTEGPISDPIGIPDMKERVDLVTRELGLRAHRPPLDAADFIAAHLEPNSLVYIEDPFGKMDDEFQHSLHTYEFFDLNRFVSALSAGEPRSTCHILITSREGLFERWHDEVLKKASSAPELALIKIGPDSYSLSGRLLLTRNLLATRGVAAPEKAALSIIEHVDVPFDAMLIARDLPQNATTVQVVASAEKISHQYAEKLSGLVSADMDAERLFLLIFSALSMGAEGRYDFYTSYELVHKNLAIAGDVYTNVQASLARYRALYTRLGIARFDVLSDMLSEHADFHLEPVHSTVNESINSYLKHEALGFLDRVALVLPEIEKHPLLTSTEKIVGMFILRLAFDEVQEKSRDAIFAALFGIHGGEHLDIPELLSWWKTLPVKYKEQFFTFVSRQDNRLVESCAMLTKIGLPKEDAWRLLRLLAESPGLGAGEFRVWGDPWGYLIEHIDGIQPDVLRRLNEEANARPATFTYALGDVIVARWEKVPQEWRDAFTHPKSLTKLNVQERVSIAIAERYSDGPEELRKFFDGHVIDPDYRMKAATAIAALLKHKFDPESFSLIAKRVAEDPDVRAPLYVLTRTRADGKQYQKFVETLLNRADEATAACLLNILLYDGKGEVKSGWKLEAAKLCAAKGGELVRAVLAFNGLDHPSGSACLGFEPPTCVPEESSPVKLSWLWSYANTKGRNPRMSLDEVRQLIQSLDENEGHLAVNYMTAQAASLPREVREFVERLGASSETYTHTVEEGKTNQQPHGHGRTTWTYPSEQFLRGEHESIYASLLTYHALMVPVIKGLTPTDNANAESRSVITIMRHPSLDDL